MRPLTEFPSAPLCVVGNVNRDVKAHAVPASPALLLDGETSVGSVSETVGGGGANSACAAAALGAAVRFVGKVGADSLGERLRLALERHGVSTFLSRDASCVTGTTLALGYASGHRHFLSCLPNNQTLSFEDLDLVAIEGCGHLLRADVWFSQSMLEDGNRRLFLEARRRGLVISLDINFDPRWNTASAAEIAARKQSLRGVLELVDVAHGNVRELCEFADASTLDTALRRLTDWGAGSVIVHMGAEGAGCFSGGQWVVEPPSPAQRCVNTTGTGDVLSMCMILLHARPDLSVCEKLRLANQVVREFMEGSRTMIPSI